MNVPIKKLLVFISFTVQIFPDLYLSTGAVFWKLARYIIIKIH